MFFLSHLIYSFSVIYGNTQSLFYELFYELILNPKLELYNIQPRCTKQNPNYQWSDSISFKRALDV